MFDHFGLERLPNTLVCWLLTSLDARATPLDPDIAQQYIISLLEKILRCCEATKTVTSQALVLLRDRLTKILQSGSSDDSQGEINVVRSRFRGKVSNLLQTDFCSDRIDLSETDVSYS